MRLLAVTGGDTAVVLAGLGALVVGLGILARLADMGGFSAVPLFLVSGLLFGPSGVVALPVGEEFLSTAASIGVVLLLLLLGLEYTPDDLRSALRDGLPAGVVDAALNFPPGVAAGLMLGWDLTSAVLLGGVTYISSSGIAAKVIADLGRIGNRETPVVLSILVMEDLAMALYLPLMSIVLAGASAATGALTLAVAVGATAVVFLGAMRYGPRFSDRLLGGSDEGILLTVLGLTLLVAGLAEKVQVSAAVGAFLVGIAVSGSVVERVRALMEPLRDLFAALFFLFFGFGVDAATLAPVLGAALLLAAATTATKLASAWWAARRAEVGAAGRWRAATVLVARGEFSIVIAGIGLAGGADANLRPLAAAYVLVLAVAAPLLTRWADLLPRTRRRAKTSTP
jgi:CPA2 family monovalent cation:H+ antiporter-2